LAESGEVEHPVENEEMKRRSEEEKKMRTRGRKRQDRGWKERIDSTRPTPTNLISLLPSLPAFIPCSVVTIIYAAFPLLTLHSNTITHENPPLCIAT